MSKLLINESPLQVLPSLAVKVGLNEAIFLQQLHFWMGVAKKSGAGREHDGKVWSYKTFDEWQQENFPFWGVSTIKRLVDRLAKTGLILVEKLDSHRRIQTNFYTINYDLLESLCEEIERESNDKTDATAIVPDRNGGECQSDTMERIKMTRPTGSKRNDVSVSTENTSETTTENISGDSPDDSKFEHAWKLYPKRAGGNSKMAARKAWNARIKAGVDPDDMIDGVRRYAAYCAATQRAGTQYVRQAATFFGPDLHFEDDFDVPPDGATGGNKSDRHAAWNARMNEVISQATGAPPQIKDMGVIDASC